MPEHKQVKVVTAAVIYESAPGRGRKDNDLYVQDTLKRTFKAARDMVVTVVLWDEDGHLIGMDTVGNPSPEMKRVIDMETREQEPA